MKNLYADRRAPDGVFANGWRRVRSGGMVGDLVYVEMNDYWMQEIIIHAGRVGCTGFLCRAKPAPVAEKGGVSDA
jgi:hypothetical protein